MSKAFDWSLSVAYDDVRKRSFHSTARARLRKLAHDLRLAPGSYDIRSNQGGIAVSGEVTLHHERVYVQASQSCIGRGMGVLIRTCRGRKDYVGGGNHWHSLDTLDTPNILAALVRHVQRADTGVGTRVA